MKNIAWQFTASLCVAVSVLLTAGCDSSNGNSKPGDIGLDDGNLIIDTDEVSNTTGDTVVGENEGGAPISDDEGSVTNDDSEIDDIPEIVSDSNLASIEVCIDDREFDPEDVVQSGGVAIDRFRWRQDKITVSFMGGTDFQRGKVVQYAQIWESHASIDFEFIASSGNIRVSFVAGLGHKSAIGKSALDKSASESTMNFDANFFNENAPEENIQRAVLHEFGHALGLVHEHQSPVADIPWNRSAVYSYFAQPPNNWMPDRVDRNIFARYSSSETNYTAFDPQSVMLYAIDNDLTVGDYEVPWNNMISPTDSDFVSRLYPIAETPPPLVAEQHVFSERFECRKNSDRGCTAHRQICASPQRERTYIDTSSVSISIADFYGVTPVCRLDSVGTDAICITGHIESGGGFNNLGVVYTIDCQVSYIDRPF